MSHFLLIESRDPFETNDVEFCYDLAARLVRQGDQVTVFLVENGVLPARGGARSEPLSALATAGVEVLADDFSLRERGIAADRLAVGVTSAPLDIVVDRLASGSRTIWH